MRRHSPPHFGSWLSLVLAAVVVSGCGGPTLAPTPNLYLGADADAFADPFADVVPSQRGSRVELFYITDRAPEEGPDGGLYYGYGRSPSAAFGRCFVGIGEDLPWETLVQQSRVKKRRMSLDLTVEGIEELVRFPPSNAPFVEIDGERREDPDVLAAREAAFVDVSDILAERVAQSRQKEIFLFVHGYNNTFDDAALRIAQLWHFMGRVGVPAFYTWPAGHPGLLRGYTYDRESGEYTIFHLRNAIRALAASPHVEKIHLIGHSRGTDVLMSALRELYLYCQGAGLDTREELKLGNVVLAAPDLDFEVVTQRIAAERLHLVPERLTMYLSEEDRAIGIASWLFASVRRLGQLVATDLTEEQQRSLELFPEIQFIEVNVKTDFVGHGYFISNPAVLSDLILVLRDDRPPGAEHGRPLRRLGSGFWELDDRYPEFESIPEAGE